MKPDIVRRYLRNPILTKASIPYPVETVHNAAVVKHENEYIMLFRSHLRTGRSIIGLARSPEGFHFTADPQPFLTPARDSPFAAYEEFGVEDPRVTGWKGSTSSPTAPTREVECGSLWPRRRTSVGWRGSPSSPRQIIGMW
jgi:predicted GH43/DUF377 family glycosyl hydrolase